MNGVAKPPAAAASEPIAAPAVFDRLRRRALMLALLPLALAAIGAAALALWAPAWPVLRSPAGMAAVLSIALVGLLVLTASIGTALLRRWAVGTAAPLTRLSQTLSRLCAGDLRARTGLQGDDPLARAGARLDTFLDERVVTLERAARDSEELNDSVIEIMQAVGTIATRRDLTLRVPVTENITGAIADALNLLTDETRRLLLEVRTVSRQVAEATVAVKSQSESASRAAAREQREVGLAASELAAAALALGSIADAARACNDSAERAVVATLEAMRRVGETVSGIGRSRTLIRETEKRIKRLGERSQEIGQAVGIVQSISERTGILALNASMRAASAGEAGRGFAVVADEVKRLSESAREATSQIARLVGAIQTETQDTMVAMNQAISQVVEISRLAEEAGVGMRHTQEQTESLASSVREIAGTSLAQAKVGATLQERARIILDASGETARLLALQTQETARLVESAKSLLDEIGRFKIEEH